MIRQGAFHDPYAGAGAPDLAGGVFNGNAMFGGGLNDMLAEYIGNPQAGVMPSGKGTPPVMRPPVLDPMSIAAYGPQGGQAVNFSGRQGAQTYKVPPKLGQMFARLFGGGAGGPAA